MSGASRTRRVKDLFMVVLPKIVCRAISFELGPNWGEQQ
jgi:hypothetical protein